MIKIIAILLFLSILFYVSIGLYLFLFQKNFIFFPTPQTTTRWIDSFELTNQDVKLKVWLINQGKNKSIIYFGGNGESVENNAAPYMSLFPDHTLYLLNYRGYSGSTGRPSEQGFYDDALALYEFVKAKHPSTTIIGRSLGTAVANFLAANRPIEKLVLITPFDSITNLAQAAFPLYPMSILLKHKFDAISRVDSIKAKTLILVAEHDEIIPKTNSDALIEEFPADQREVKQFPNTSHNSISSHPNYLDAIHRFVKEPLIHP